MKGDVVRALSAIDWDFAGPRSGYAAPLHWYPGTFVPALSDALIEALTPVGGTVFDPYCGIGTAGWSASRTSRSCHLADVNPIALLGAYATTSLLTLTRTDRNWVNAALGALGCLIGRNEDLFGPIETREVPQLDQIVDQTCAPAPATMLAQIVAGPPVWDALRCWFDPETLTHLEALVGTLAQSKSVYVQLLGLCMVSATARNLSSQHASWGHIADNVRPRELKQQNVATATIRWLKRAKTFLAQPMILGRPDIDAQIRPHVHLRDWSKPNSPGAGEADLLVTSPPYADAIDYTLAQRLSLYLLGYDDEAILALVFGEIGARRKRFRSVSRVDWSELLCIALRDQVTWLKPEGAVCLVLPHKDHGRGAGEGDLKVSLEKLGWRLYFERDRSIHQAHARQSWTSIKQETILVFARK